jgi:hypothetical protein
MCLLSRLPGIERMTMHLMREEFPYRRIVTFHSAWFELLARPQWGVDGTERWLFGDGNDKKLKLAGEKEGRTYFVNEHCRVDSWGRKERTSCCRRVVQEERERILV